MPRAVRLFVLAEVIMPDMPSDYEERAALIADGNPGMSRAEAERLARADTQRQPALDQIREAKWAGESEDDFGYIVQPHGTREVKP